MREHLLVQRLVSVLRAQGAYVVKAHGSPFTRGRPDVEACYKGLYVAVEVKRPGERLTALQETTLDEIRRAGGVTAVVRYQSDIDHLVSVLEGKVRGDGCHGSSCSPSA